MTYADLTFIVVEDHVLFQNEVLNQLAKAEFSVTNRLGIAGTYDDAKELLQEHATKLDVVFLDLNIPRHAGDPKPEEKHGMALMDLIHHDLNKRPGVDIRIIIVSGQDLAANESGKALMVKLYSPTLVGVAEKAAMAAMLKANLRRLRRDPLVSSLSRLEGDLLSQWETLTDTSKPTLDRLSAARGIAIRIAQNEIDHREGRKHSHPEFDDKLGRICGHIMGRFDVPYGTSKQQVSTGVINSTGGWGCFVWRGVLMEHFRIIDSYWNAYKHLAERPYNNPTQDADEWTIGTSLQERCNKGETVVKIVELAVRDLLEWYLPWHEQVLAKNS